MALATDRPSHWSDHLEVADLVDRIWDEHQRGTGFGSTSGFRTLTPKATL
ncbi:hypothetical protein [Ruegeria atlantica]|nr:hypothetical protein [Ruegeria atlantica]